MKRRILIVEDDIALLETLTDRLESDGYLVRAVADGNSGFGQARDGGFDLIVLDLMLPGRDGLNICTDLRHRRVTTPILMLTARGDVTDRVLGLRMGADDYLPKPFHMSELAARVDALIRRSSARKADPVAFRFGTLEIDFRAGRISREGRPITLAAREWELLRYLVEHAGAVLSREELLKEVWALAPDLITRTVDVHILWLRQKLELHPKNPQLILTVPRRGYKLANVSVPGVELPLEIGSSSAAARPRVEK